MASAKPAETTKSAKTARQELDASVAAAQAGALPQAPVPDAVAVARQAVLDRQARVIEAIRRENAGLAPLADDEPIQ